MGGMRTMGRREISLGCAIWLAACAGGGQDPPIATPDVVADEAMDAGPTVEVPRATCEAPIGGSVELHVDHSYEAFPGYDAQLAAQLIDALDETLDLAGIGILQRSLVAYMLEIPLDDLPDAMDRDAIGDHEPMGLAVLGAFAEAQGLGDEGLDLAFLRRGLHRFYQCDRRFPLRLEDFRAAILDYTGLAYYEVMSVPKNTTRRIFESHEDGVYVGEAIIEGEVRETEILMTSSRTDGAIDFVAYDEAGDLVDRGEFTTAAGTMIGGATPYTCIACHFEPGTFRINVIFPDMAPVAPREGP